MTKNTIWGILAALVIVIAGVWFFRSRTNTATTPAPVASTTAPAATDLGNQAVIPPSTPSATTGGTQSTPSHVTVNVTGGMFFFQPNIITVKKGQIVTVHFTVEGGTHNFTLDAFSVATPTISAGQSADVTFVASKTGSFEYHCSVDSHRERGMTGTLIVQ